MQMHASQYRSSAWFVTKAMHSRHFNVVLDAVRRYYDDVDAWKPLSSRPASRETYIVAHRLKSSAVQDYQQLRITPRMSPFSLWPHADDVLSGGRRVWWMCHQCGNMGEGCSPCIRCR
jgi:hypothetical protein